MLEARKLWKAFQGKQIFTDVSLTCQENQTIALLGESGAGKSTLAKIFAGLLAPDAGEVLWRGQAIRALSSTEKLQFYRSVQYIGQSPTTWFDPRLRLAVSLQEALHIHHLEMKNAIPDAMEKFHLTPSMAKRRPKELSGGELQRFALVRALILQPKFLLLDEPTSMLDLSTQADILHILRNLHEEEGIGYLLVTHETRAAFTFCNKCLSLERGRIHFLEYEGRR